MDVKDRGTILFGASKGMSAQLASQIIGDGMIDQLMPPQTTYRNKRRKELRRLLYNLIYAQSLSRAHERLIKVAVPLRKIYHNKGAYHRISYRGFKAVVEELEAEGLIEVEKGRRFADAPVLNKHRLVGRLKDRVALRVVLFQLLGHLLAEVVVGVLRLPVAVVEVEGVFEGAPSTRIPRSFM